MVGTVLTVVEELGGKRKINSVISLGLGGRLQAGALRCSLSTF